MVRRRALQEEALKTGSLLGATASCAERTSASVAVHSAHVSNAMLPEGSVLGGKGAACNKTAHTARPQACVPLLRSLAVSTPEGTDQKCKFLGSTLARIRTFGEDSFFKFFFLYF